MTINNHQITLKNISIDIVSENSVILTWPEIIDVEQHQQIITCQQYIQESLKQYIIEILTSYNSIMVYYRFDKIPSYTLLTALKKCLQTIEYQQTSINNKTTPATVKNVEIPVYYGLDAGWDLPFVAQQTTLSTDDIIHIHSKQVYRAYALGFTPGFCYLASLPKALQLTRKAKPRKVVPKGAVAIAEQQTSVYPNESPGGWHIIGQTPTPMYSMKNEIFTPLIQVGDNVSFKAINQERFLALGGVIHHE